MIPELAEIADPVERAEAERLVAELCDRLEWRIRPLVGHLPEEAIQALLGQMAWLKYKHEGARCLDSTPSRPRPIPPEMPPADGQDGQTFTI